MIRDENVTNSIAEQNKENRIGQKKLNVTIDLNYFGMCYKPLDKKCHKVEEMAWKIKWACDIGEKELIKDFNYLVHKNKSKNVLFRTT